MGHVARARIQAAQQQRELLALDQSAWKLDFAAAQAKLEVHQEIVVVLAASERQLVARGIVPKRVAPVGAFDDGLQIVGALAGCVQAAHDGAHAGAGDAVDRDFELLEHFQDAHVGRSACAAAAQGQPHGRSVFGGIARRCGGAVCRGQHQDQRGQGTACG